MKELQSIPEEQLHVLDIGKRYFFTNCSAEAEKSALQKWMKKEFEEEVNPENIIFTSDVCLFEDEKRVIQVDVIDANHCPGACLFLYHFYHLREREFSLFYKTLYTGDFRNYDGLVSNTPLSKYALGSPDRLDLIYVDNTYRNIADSLPSQDLVVDSINHMLDLYWKKKILSNEIVVCVCIYIIGKEKVWLGIAKHFNIKAYVTE